MFVDGRTRRSRLALGLPLAALLAASVSTGCGGPYEPVPPAPPFQLEDQNPASPTAGEVRSPGDIRGKVLLIYFVSFG